MPVEMLFASPVQYGYVSPEQKAAIDCEIKRVLPVIKAGDLSNPWGDAAQTSFTYAGTHDIRDHDMRALASAIYQQIFDYAQALCAKDDLKMEIFESWFNITTRGQYQHAHSHQLADLCVVYYHKTNEEDGKIAFNTPCSAHSMSSLFVQHVSCLETREQVSYAPQEGKIIVFPGYLQHLVFENETDSERISVAANVKIFR